MKKTEPKKLFGATADDLASWATEIGALNGLYDAVEAELKKRFDQAEAQLKEPSPEVGKMVAEVRDISAKLIDLKLGGRERRELEKRKEELRSRLGELERAQDLKRAVSIGADQSDSLAKVAAQSRANQIADLVVHHRDEILSALKGAQK